VTPAEPNYEREERLAIARAEQQGREEAEAQRLRDEMAASLERIRVLAERNRRDAWLKKRFKGTA